MGPWECVVSKGLEQQRRSMRRISEMYIFKFRLVGLGWFGLSFLWVGVGWCL